MISRILIVGYGSIAKRHIRVARYLFPDADIRVLKHRVQDDQLHAVNGIFFDINEAIKFKPNVAVVANPATLHIKVGKALAESGIHLLIEKPISTSFDGVEELIEICRRNSIILLVGYNLRFLVDLQMFRGYLRDGIIGTVLSVRCDVGQYLPNWRPDTDYRNCVSASSELGGGVLLELSHEIDYIQWIFGRIGWVRATTSRQSDLEINVEDTSHITFSSSPVFQRREILGSINLDFIRQDATRQCTAIGDKGTLIWNGVAGSVSLYESTKGGWQELFHLPKEEDDSYIAEWNYFIKCIGCGAESVSSGYESLKVLEVIDAIRRSSSKEGATCVTRNFQSYGILK